MVDSLINKPILSVTTFVKRHWLVVAFVVLLLLLVPPFIEALSRLFNTLAFILRTGFAAFGLGARVGASAREGLERAASTVENFGSKTVDWLSAKPARKWIPAAAAFFGGFPRLGAALAVWLLVDRVKQSTTVNVIVETAEPETATETREPAPAPIWSWP